MKTHRPLHVLGEVHGQEKVHILLPNLLTRERRSDAEFKFLSFRHRREREIEEFKVFTSCSPSMCLSNRSWLKKAEYISETKKKQKMMQKLCLDHLPSSTNQNNKIENIFSRNLKKNPWTTCHRERRSRPHRGHSAGKEAPQAFFHKVLNQTERFG